VGALRETAQQNSLEDFAMYEAQLNHTGPHGALSSSSRIESRLAPYAQGIQMPGSGLDPVQMTKGVSDPEVARLAESILQLRQQIYFTRDEWQTAREATEFHGAKLKHLEAELEQTVQEFLSVVKQGI
jgi:hypothetical protein